VAYDEALASRVRAKLDGTGGVEEKKMFGGIAFLVHGNMAVGVSGTDLMVRVDPAEADAMLAQPGVRVFDMTGRPMKGWLLVDADVLADDSPLAQWIDRGVAFARSLPGKLGRAGGAGFAARQACWRAGLQASGLQFLQACRRAGSPGLPYPITRSPESPLTP
jgi:TfoX/Sxy family transcriptional regulator of competence genes